MKEKLYIIQIIEKATKKEVLRTVIIGTSINEVGKKSFLISQVLGYNDLLTYDIWTGTPKAYIKYRAYMSNNFKGFKGDI